MGELYNLQPRVGDRFAKTLALQQYSNEHPRDMARRKTMRRSAPRTCLTRQASAHGEVKRLFADMWDSVQKVPYVRRRVAS